MGKPKNILYLSYDGLTDPLGQSQILPYLIPLTNYNYQFTIVSFEKETNFKQGKEKIEKTISNYPIYWKPLLYHKSPPVISTLYDIFLLGRVVSQLIKHQDIQIIHCRSYIAALIGLRMKKRHGIKFIFDMRGFWADERVEGGLWNLKNPLFRIIYRYFKDKEREFLTEADHVVTLTYNSKQAISKGDLWGRELSNSSKTSNHFMRLREEKISVIPTCVDMELFDPDKVEGNDCPDINRLKEKVKDKWVLSYLGSIGTWYMLDEMLLFFKALLDKVPNAMFLFITTHVTDEILVKAEKIGIPKERIIIQPTARNEVPVYLSFSDYNIFFIRPTFSKQASAATKMGEALAMGIPVITNSGWGDVEEIIKKENCGILVDEFTETAYQEVLRTIDHTSEVRDNTFKVSKILKVSKVCRSAAEKYFSLEIGVERYRKIYQSL